MQENFFAKTVKSFFHKKEAPENRNLFIGIGLFDDLAQESLQTFTLGTVSYTHLISMPRPRNRRTMLYTSPMFSSTSVFLASLSPWCDFAINARVLSVSYTHLVILYGIITSWGLGLIYWAFRCV